MDKKRAVEKIKGMKNYTVGERISAYDASRLVKVTTTELYEVLDEMTEDGLLDKFVEADRIYYVRKKNNIVKSSWRHDNSVYTQDYTPRWT